MLKFYLYFKKEIFFYDNYLILVNMSCNLTKKNWKKILSNKLKMSLIFQKIKQIKIYILYIFLKELVYYFINFYYKMQNLNIIWELCNRKGWNFKKK